MKAAGYAELLPMVRFRTGGPLAPAQPMPAGTPPPPAPIDMRTVSHEFVTAMGMRIVAGRTLRQDDERAVLMNETLARSGFLGPQALGQQVLVAGHPDPFEVVGIVRDVRQYGLDQDPDPQVFVDARQLPPGNPTPYFAVRVDGDPTGYVSSVREAVRQMDSSAAIDNVATMQQIVSNALSRPRLFAVLAAAFAIVGALLAAIGVYGVTAYAVTQRTRELAVRLALGARPSELLLMVIRQGVAWTVVGLFLGVAGEYCPEPLPAGRAVRHHAGRSDDVRGGVGDVSRGGDAGDTHTGSSHRPRRSARRAEDAVVNVMTDDRALLFLLSIASARSWRRPAQSCRRSKCRNCGRICFSSPARNANTVVFVQVDGRRRHRYQGTQGQVGGVRLPMR